LEKGVELRDIPIPEVGAGEVLIKVVDAGICGTDLAIYAGSLKVPTPLILGHEFSGIIAKGPEKWLRKPVVSEINTACGKCHFCRIGERYHCINRKALGVTMDGCFAEYVKVPEKNVHEIPFSFEEGIFVEPLAAAIQTVKRTKISVGENVLVFGCGRLGLLVVQVMRLQGANVFAFDRDDSKLKLASSFDANVVSPDEKGLPMFDVIVECTGDPSALNKAIELVKPTGTVALKSTPGGLSRVKMTLVAQKEIRIQGSRCGPFDVAISFIRDGKVQVKKLISNRFCLEKYKEAFGSKGIKNIFTIGSKVYSPE
jgi:threonine dehydrogenase-like Zn-dependent dehydrogenase